MIFSDDENSTWLALVQLWNLLTGQAQSIWDSVKLAVPATITGDLTVGDDLTVVDDAAIGGDLTVTGDNYHGDRKLNLAGCAGASRSSTVSYETDGGGLYTGTSAATVYYALPLREGDRIKSLTFAMGGDGTADLTVDVRRCTDGTHGTATSSLGSNSYTNPGVSIADRTIDLTDTKLGAGEIVFVLATATAGATVGIYLNNLIVTFDRPAP